MRKNIIKKSLLLLLAAVMTAGQLVACNPTPQTPDETAGETQSSDLIILAGRPAMGKTSLATNIAFNIAKAYRSEKAADGTSETVNGGIVGFFFDM